MPKPGDESSTRSPPCSSATPPTRPYGSSRAGPPSSGSAWAHGCARDIRPTELTASTSLSAVQPRTAVHGSPQWLSRRTGPPSVGATWTSGAPSRVEVQASSEPSGENRGLATGT